MAHYVYWLGQDGNLWVNQNGNTRNIGKPVGDYWKNGYAEGTNFSMADQGTLIEDPNKPAENPTSDSYTTTSGAGSGSYSTTNAEEEATKRRMRGIYDEQIADINKNLDSQDNQLDNTLKGVENEYNTYKNEQQSSYNANENDYNNSTLQNMQNLQTNRNEITNRASSGLRGLLRILGAMGAGGGSVARYEAPGMVTSQANAEMNNAGQTYAQNQSNLDTDWGNYKEQFENDKKKLEDWRTNQIKAKKQENYEKRQSLLQDLVTAYGNRAQYGGDYGSDMKGAFDRINEYRNKVNELGQFTPTQYTGMTSVFKSPELSSYDTGNTNLSTTVTESNTSASSPILAALQGLSKRKNNNPYAYSREA